MTAGSEIDIFRITSRLGVRRNELSFRFSRSSGPGGQNLNKVNTRVTLRFDVDGSPSLSEGQKRLVLRRLCTRITREGVLQVVSSRHRTQAANRRAVTERFVELLADAVKPPRQRKATAVPQRSRAQRLEDKARRGQTKRLRSQPATGE